MCSSDLDVTADPPYRRNIGLVFQNYALFPHLNIFENVAFGLRRRKLSEVDIKTRVGEALELVRLGHLEDRYPKQLSGGQQQRVAVQHRRTRCRKPVLDRTVLAGKRPVPGQLTGGRIETEHVAGAEESPDMTPVGQIRVAVTGAAGQIGYALVFRIASGQMFGPATQRSSSRS